MLRMPCESQLLTSHHLIDRLPYYSKSFRHFSIHFMPRHLLVVATKVLPVAFKSAGLPVAPQFSTVFTMSKFSGPIEEPVQVIRRCSLQSVFWVLPDRPSGLLRGFHGAIPNYGEGGKKGPIFKGAYRCHRSTTLVRKLFVPFGSSKSEGISDNSSSVLSSGSL